jgi:1-acyl-sn-glycerol-3-phosphate acyltransferase|tara:strand:+ start:5308 stop:6033 length:726 start_codon:yes stop_codon:yes gene_type:complete
MSTLVAFTRSLLFYVIYVTILTFFGTFACSFGMFLPCRARHNVVTLANALIVKWLNVSCGITLRIDGLKNVPKTPCVILSKHQSGWETFYLQRLLRPVSTILKKELFWIPFFGWALYFMHPIAINRSNPREALKQILSQGLQRLASGKNVLIYPEGTRLPLGEIGRYGRSGAALAIAAGVQIIPISHNAGYCWPARAFIKRPGQIHISIGEPIETNSGDDSRLLMEHVKNVIESTQKTLKH